MSINVFFSTVVIFFVMFVVKRSLSVVYYTSFGGKGGRVLMTDKMLVIKCHKVEGLAFWVMGLL